MVGCVLEEPSRNGLDDVIVRVGNIRELVTVKKFRFYKSREFLAILHGEITCTLRGSVCRSFPPQLCSTAIYGFLHFTLISLDTQIFKLEL